MKKQSISILVILFVLFGCSDDLPEPQNNCITNDFASITSVNAPDTGEVNEKINIEVKFQANSGCGNFGRFIETELGNTKTIEVEAKYEGCYCTRFMKLITVNYEFTPKNTGTYNLNFKSGSTEFIVMDLTID